MQVMHRLGSLGPAARRRLAGASAPRISALLTVVVAAVLSLAGCASAPRPVPVSNQPFATAQAANLVITVPRLDYGAYPGDVLDVTAAVYVVLENRGSTEIAISPADFSLGPPGGLRSGPVDPAALALKQTPPFALSGADGLALLTLEGSDRVYAARGGGGGGRGFGGGGRSFFGGGASRSGARSGRQVTPGTPGNRPGYGPGYGGPGFRGGPGYGSYGRGFYGYRPGLGWGYGFGPWWPYWDPSFYGWYPGPDNSWYGPRYYAYSRQDAVRLALPIATLPPGGRTGGFLYFPRVAEPDGSTLVLRWQPHDATTHAPVADVQLPLQASDE